MRGSPCWFALGPGQDGNSRVRQRAVEGSACIDCLSLFWVYIRARGSLEREHAVSRGDLRASMNATRWGGVGRGYES